MLSLDHVSVRASTATLRAQGFHVTPTPGGAGDHARIMLDGVYLELRADADEEAVPRGDEEAARHGNEEAVPRGLEGAVRGAGWFVRSDDQVAAGRRLGEAGILVSDLTPYEGLDGAWLDLALAGPSPVTPTLTRRVDLSDWPPPLAEPHPNGAVSIAELRLGARQPEPLIALITLAGAGLYGPGRLRLENAELHVEPSVDDRLLEILFRRHDGDLLALTLGDVAH